MNTLIVVAVALLALSLVYQWGARTSRKVATNTGIRLHSRAGYHGLLVAMWCAIPAGITYILYLIFEPMIAEALLRSFLPADVAADPGATRAAMDRMRNIASGFGATGDITPFEAAGAEALTRFKSIAWFALIAVIAAVGAIGAALAQRQISPSLRARNRVEAAIKIVLLVCSAIAVLTTVGIVLSVLSEAIRFFTFVDPISFFLGTEWNPRFSTVGTEDQGQFGLIPLLW
ncbi:MAG: phosphate ABC transporter permease family protein, partial [Pseudomonadota bacterium]